MSLLLSSMASALSRATGRAPRVSRKLSVRALALDHVCVCVTDIEASIKWYCGVLGLNLRHSEEPHFYPKSEVSPAFLTPDDESSGVALLQLDDPAQRILDHRGAHFALRVDQAEFLRAAQGSLKSMLEEHRVHHEQSIDVEECDYGIQRSLFFSDPDGNVVELASWGY